MDTLTTWLGEPPLPTVLLLAALLWVAVRLVETGAQLLADHHARRSGWALTADPALLDAVAGLDERLTTLLDQRADDYDVAVETSGYAQRSADRLDELTEHMTTRHPGIGPDHADRPTLARLRLIDPDDCVRRPRCGPRDCPNDPACGPVDEPAPVEP